MHYRLTLALLLAACGGGTSPDASMIDGDTPDHDSSVPTDACVPMCTGLACGSDGCGGSCGTCGASLACNAGRCEPSSCPASCTDDCPQGCFPLGDCVGGASALDLTANIFTVGVVITASGPSAEVYYRSSGADRWWRAVDAVPLPDGRLATSLFSLAPDSDYELRVDAGGAISCGTVHTQPIDPPHTTTETLYVDASAAPGGDGSMSAPFASIQDAIDAASAGTDIVVRSGIYRESVSITSAGDPGRYLRLIADSGAILDGADPSAHPSWTSDRAGIWHTAWTRSPSYLTRDGQRMYHYDSRADLESGTGHMGASIDEGWYVEAGQLYVRSASDPSTHEWQLPMLDVAFALDGASWIWIEGFEIRFYGEGDYPKGIDVRASDHVVVRGNHIRETPSPVWVRRGSNDVRVENNEIHQSSIFGWPWSAVKATDHENSAVTLEGGRGAIASGNVIHDIFNGIYAGSFDAQDDATIAFDVDVYANRMTRIGDDGLEPEGACVNQRFWQNSIDRVHNGISFAPITWGPVWAVRNRFTDYDESGFKVSNDSTARVWIFHNTCYTDRPDQNGMGVSGNFTNMVFRNNVVRGTRYAIEMSMEAQPNDLDYDNWFTTRGAPVVKWSDVRYDSVADWCGATGLECHAQPEDPALIDPSSARFGLQASSPNVDAAVRIYGINDEYAGDAPDIGYVEHGRSEPPALP